MGEGGAQLYVDVCQRCLYRHHLTVHASGVGSSHVWFAIRMDFDTVFACKKKKDLEYP